MDKIRKITIDMHNDDVDDVTFYFEGSDEPFSVREFEIGSLTRKTLEAIEYEIQDYNSECILES